MSPLLTLVKTGREMTQMGTAADWQVGPFFLQNSEELIKNDQQIHMNRC